VTDARGVINGNNGLMHGLMENKIVDSAAASAYKQDESLNSLSSSVFDPAAIDRETPSDLAKIGSDKWTRYPNCIGAFIAEMDFGLAPCIQEAMVEAVQRCSLGYIPDPLKRQVAKACAHWQQERFNWHVSADCIRPVPDVMEAYEIFLREFVGAGNTVIVPTPAYMPFLSVPQLHGITVIEIAMLQRDGGWEFDFSAIEDAFRKGCKAFVLCNPHNPIGKVLTREEMLTISQLADQYDVRIFSDEIHASFVFDDATHIPFASINEKTAMQAITATSVSKAFNVPGTKCAQVILTNPEDYALWMNKAEWSEHQTATIGAVATIAAYEHGGAWFDEMFPYVLRNRDYVDEQMRTRFAEVGYTQPQGTYIAWLDFLPLGLHDPASFFLEHAQVALTDGLACGRIGEGCVRMNFAMPYPLLQECFERMYLALVSEGIV
jgi:cystathionine beta-lyase